ncbi:hypothetical protein I312_100705 [Cryptococcus bacillisporus CA1280]|uniref:uncharacterized protein n=1 Tax=Cryptococcus bacillisporus CA1280 TaxID=1296109 RepID=UPI0033690E87
MNQLLDAFKFQHDLRGLKNAKMIWMMAMRLRSPRFDDMPSLWPITYLLFAAYLLFAIPQPRRLLSPKDITSVHIHWLTLWRQLIPGCLDDM